MKDTRKADLFAKLFTKIINLAEDGDEATEILENCGMTQNEIDDAAGIEHRGNDDPMQIEVIDCAEGLVIITENVEGNIYIIVSECFQDILDVWDAECNFVPENNARVFFAAWNGQPLNPHDYTDFESFLRMLEIKST